VKVLAPEYGGDGRAVGRCGQVGQPVLAFPAHWAPNALLFYTGRQFPSEYRDGLFVAFHGSWNRAPLPQQGYSVVFAPFGAAGPRGDWRVFADGFRGGSQAATYRPTGLAQGPDGSLYVSDDRGGRIYRIMYTGR
jgi:glucose/arabinose dehydrogenase